MDLPLFSSVPTMVDPVNATRVWLFEEQAMVVDQTFAPISESMARFITVNVEAEVQRLWVSKGRKVTFIHDWRNSRDYEAAGRDLLLTWGRASLGHAKLVRVQIARDSSTFVRIAVATGISAMKLARMPIDSVDDLSPWLREVATVTPITLR